MARPQPTVLGPARAAEARTRRLATGLGSSTLSHQRVVGSEGQGRGGEGALACPIAVQALEESPDGLHTTHLDGLRYALSLHPRQGVSNAGEMAEPLDSHSAGGDSAAMWQCTVGSLCLDTGTWFPSQPLCTTKMFDCVLPDRAAWLAS